MGNRPKQVSIDSRYVASRLHSSIWLEPQFKELNVVGSIPTASRTINPITNTVRGWKTRGTPNKRTINELHPTVPTKRTPDCRLKEVRLTTIPTLSPFFYPPILAG